MLNLIRMDFYRLFKSFSLWITLAVTAIIAIVIGLFYNLIELSGNETFAIDEIIMEIFSGTDILIICTIFISLFVYADFKNGFIKNIAGQLNHRSKLVLSKSVIMITYITILILVYFISLTLILALTGNNFSFDISVDLFIFIAIELILHFAFGSIIIMLCVISNSNALSIAIGIMMSSGIFSLLYSGIDYLIEKLDLGISFSVYDYSLMNNIKYMTIHKESDLVKALCVGIVFYVISLALSMLAIEKKDIK